MIHISLKTQLTVNMKFRDEEVAQVPEITHVPRQDISLIQDNLILHINSFSRFTETTFANDLLSHSRCFAVRVLVRLQMFEVWTKLQRQDTLKKMPRVFDKSGSGFTNFGSINKFQYRSSTKKAVSTIIPG